MANTRKVRRGFCPKRAFNYIEEMGHATDM